MLLQYEKQKQYTRRNNLIEINYDDLVTDPFAVACEIYSALNIDLHDSTHVTLKRYISAEASYECNSYH